MKKILLTAAATTVLASSSAFAYMDGDYYGTLYGGMNKLNQVKDEGDKLKSENTGHIGVGVGYYVNEMFRTDLTFDHLFDPKFKGSGTDEDGYKFNSKLSGEVNALMLNAYADLFDAGVAKFYVGAGAGAARLNAKLSVSYPDLNINESVKLKEQTSFAYALHLGASTEFAPGVNGFLQYSYKDYGKTSKKTKGADVENLSSALKFRGHHGSVGVRVDF